MDRATFARKVTHPAQNKRQNAHARKQRIQKPYVAYPRSGWRVPDGSSSILIGGRSIDCVLPGLAILTKRESCVRVHIIWSTVIPLHILIRALVFHRPPSL